MIELPPGFRDLLVELADAKAAFVLVGGYAVAFHGHPRATKDMDILVRAEPDNAKLVYQALAAFGTPLSACPPFESTSSTEPTASDSPKPSKRAMASMSMVEDSR